MIQIRKGVFETNSSSTHSITFSGKELEENKMEIDYDGYIHAKFGEFGWEVRSYYDQETKLSYLLTMAMHLNDFYIWCGSTEKNEREIEEFMKTEDFERISNAVGEYAHCNGIIIDYGEGYIDHQSREYGCLDEFLYDCGTDIINFVFGDAIVNTDNDNRWPDDCDW